jgi:hypothetical protein
MIVVGKKESVKSDEEFLLDTFPSLVTAAKTVDE